MVTNRNTAIGEDCQAGVRPLELARPLAAAPPRREVCTIRREYTDRWDLSVYRKNSPVPSDGDRNDPTERCLGRPIQVTNTQVETPLGWALALTFPPT